MKKLLAALMILCMLLGSITLANAAEFYDPVYEGEWFTPVSTNTVELNIGKSVRAIAYIPGDSVENNFCTRYFEKTLNVKYNHAFQVDEGAYTGYVNQMIADAAYNMDVLPDVFTVNYEQLSQLAEAGMLADLTEAYKKYASPNLKGAMDSSEGLAAKLVTFNGQMLAIPSGDCGENSCGLYWIRKDWVDKLGAKMPETLDELIDLARRFMAEDLDGNGVNDTIGIWAGNNVFSVNSNVGVMNQLANAQNAYPEYFYCDENGKVQYGSVQPEMRDALEQMAAWVKEGVINPRFVYSDDFVPAIQGWDNMGGTCGIVSMPWWNASVPASMVITNPGQVRWDAVMLKDDNGVINMPMMNPATVFLVAKAGISEEKLEAIIKTMNLQLETDLAVGMNLYWSGDASNPFATYMMPFSIMVTYYNQKALQGKHAIQAYNGEIDMNSLYGEDYNTAYAYKRFKDAGSTFAVAQQDPDMVYMMHFFLIGAGAFNRNADDINWILPATEAVTATMKTSWNSLLAMEEQTFIRILNGEVGIEAFDQFVEDWYRLGGTQILAEKQVIEDGNHVDKIAVSIPVENTVQQAGTVAPGKHSFPISVQVNIPESVTGGISWYYQNYAGNTSGSVQGDPGANTFNIIVQDAATVKGNLVLSGYPNDLAKVTVTLRQTTNYPTAEKAEESGWVLDDTVFGGVEWNVSIDRKTQPVIRRSDASANADAVSFSNVCIATKPVVPPPTSDNSMLALWMSLAVLSLCGTAVLALRKRSRA